MRLRNTWVGLLGIALATTLVACGGSQETSSTSATPASPSAAPRRPEGRHRDGRRRQGRRRSLDGAAPKNEPIKMNADPVCVKANTTPQFQETYEVSSDGKSLGNVFVYVKDGLGNYVFDTPTEPATIDQKSCRYHPHVFGMRVGQPLEIINSDPTLHNIHAMPKGNAEFNNGQPIQGMKMTPHLRQARSDGAVQVRRARLDERLRRRHGQPVLRGDRQGRQVRAEGPAARAPTRSKRGTRSSARRPRA